MENYLIFSLLQSPHVRVAPGTCDALLLWCDSMGTFHPLSFVIFNIGNFNRKKKKNV
jgi:hypothetical protein